MNQFESALEIQMSLGKVALESVTTIIGDETIAGKTTPFTLIDGSKFEMTIKRL
ncbi:unnamed protein product [Fructobacillus fructosus]|uniref:Uncharacterized protein n=1 Tax=Fructobacillus fructosus TaxID=1631 RepID=A0ABM9MZK2_9LACO|nr:unnamed protein product [Fructobacillus fructosus]